MTNEEKEYIRRMIVEEECTVAAVMRNIPTEGHISHRGLWEGKFDWALISAGGFNGHQLTSEQAMYGKDVWMEEVWNKNNKENRK